MVYSSLWQCTSCKQLYKTVGWTVRKCPKCGSRAAMPIGKPEKEFNDKEKS